jgi:hypothetical protein
METIFAAIVAGIVTAVVLLVFGAAVGFWAGTRTVPPMLVAPSPADVTRSDEQAELLQQLALCFETGELAAVQSVALAALSHSSADVLPAEMTKAISRLVDTTGDLAAQLHNVQTSSRRSPGNTPPSEPMRVSRSANLTTEQMSSVMGGRKNLGDSTLGLEEKRYTYEAIQYFAEWDDAEPAPTLDQFSKVRCHDISVSGISFFLPEKPDFESAIISIGTGEKLMFMHIEVCQHKAVYMHREVSFLIGCRYLRRMEELTSAWHAANECAGAGVG